MNIGECLGRILPPEQLKKRLFAYSIIDVIMSDPENDWTKIYRYQKDWRQGVDLCTLDDSCGDHYHILFAKAGCVIKGFGHESDLSPYNYGEDEEYPDYGFYRLIPDEFQDLLADKALEKDLVTFCIYCKADSSRWDGAIKVTSDWALDGYSDGAETFMDYIEGFDDYKEWYEEYYEQPINLELISKIYQAQKAEEADILAINSNADVEKVRSLLQCLNAL